MVTLKWQSLYKHTKPHIIPQIILYHVLQEMAELEEIFRGGKAKEKKGSLKRYLEGAKLRKKRTPRRLPPRCAGADSCASTTNLLFLFVVPHSSGCSCLLFLRLFVNRDSSCRALVTSGLRLFLFAACSWVLTRLFLRRLMCWLLRALFYKV